MGFQIEIMVQNLDLKLFLYIGTCAWINEDKWSLNPENY